PGSVAAGLASAAITIPVCLLVGEGIAWGVGKLEQVELALAQEQDRSEQLRELDEMKDAFLSAVSHELRTPITICRGHLEVLEEGAGEREVRAVKETLLDELDLMGRLVDDLTTLARVDDRALLRLESLAMGRARANRAAPDRRQEEERAWDSGSSGRSPEPMTAGPVSLTGRGAVPRSGSRFRGESPGRRGRRAHRVVPRKRAACPRVRRR